MRKFDLLIRNIELPEEGQFLCLKVDSKGNVVGVEPEQDEMDYYVLHPNMDLVDRTHIIEELKESERILKACHSYPQLTSMGIDISEKLKFVQHYLKAWSGPELWQRQRKVREKEKQ